MNKPVTDYQQEVLVKKIDVVIKALGTMILVPQFAPKQNIGDPLVQMQPLQQGILQGEDRVLAEKKLKELIEQL